MSGLSLGSKIGLGIGLSLGLFLLALLAFLLLRRLRKPGQQDPVDEPTMTGITPPPVTTDAPRTQPYNNTRDTVELPSNELSCAGLFAVSPPYNDFNSTRPPSYVTYQSTSRPRTGDPFD